VILVCDRRWIMTRSYSLDLLVRIAAFVEDGHSRRAASPLWGERQLWH
jgi:hypothetical protein